MSKQEQETYIHNCPNDLKQGFFRYNTSKRAHVKGLLRKVGRENILSIKTSRCNKVKVFWQIKVKAECLSKDGLYIRKPGRRGGWFGKQSTTISGRLGKETRRV